jgi:hypothetical protein
MDARKGGEAGRCIGGSVHESPAAEAGRPKICARAHYDGFVTPTGAVPGVPCHGRVGLFCKIENNANIDAPRTTTENVSVQKVSKSIISFQCPLFRCRMS